VARELPNEFPAGTPAELPKPYKKTQGVRRKMQRRYYAALVGLLTGLILLTTGGTASATQQEVMTESAISLGALFGPGFFNNENGTNASLSAEAEYKYDPSLGFGVYVAYASLGSTDVPGTGTVDKTMVFVTPQVNYYFGGRWAGLHFGGKAGLSFTNTSNLTPGSTTDTKTNLAAGPSLGYDYALENGLSIGGEANYLISTSTPSSNVFNLLAAVRYWF
jgi:hypothetical protein